MARPRSTGSFNTSNSGTSAPLSGNTWTQQATEIDEVAWGALKITNPASGSCARSDGEQLDATVFVSIDGAAPMSYPVNAPSAGNSSNLLVDFTTSGFFGNAVRGKLFEPGAPTSHTITISVSDNCNSGSLLVSNLGLDVLGAS